MDLVLDNVRVERGGRCVLDVPSLHLRGGRTIAILGPNGSGKTTLLRVVAGLERPQTGRVSPGGSPVAYVFQEDVFLRRTVRENLELGLRLRGVDQPLLRTRVEESVALLGIAHLMDRRADRLSGGEGRRVSLARALCLRAPLVLLDEPLDGLDERTYVHLLDELPRLLNVFDATTLLVTHRRHEALRLAQDLVVLVDGRVHAAGDTREVAANPRVKPVADVLGYFVFGNVAVPPGRLKPGPGAREFSMVVEEIADVVEYREMVGRVGDVRVRVPLPPTGDAPAPGDRALIHAERCCVLTE
jgi:ABC-type sugar transport system ATPase subunit